MKRVGLLLMALAVCGLATAAIGAEYPFAGANRPGNDPSYQGPLYRVAGQPSAAAWQDYRPQVYATNGRVYPTGYASNYAYPASSSGGGADCGSCYAGPCGMSYGMVPKAPGCCEYSPTCCDHIWDGYCQERQERLERWRSFYASVRSTLSRPCLGGCYGCGSCGGRCGRAVSCQPACGRAAPAGVVSEPAMAPVEPMQVAPEPKLEPLAPEAPQPEAEPKSPPPAVEPEAPPAPEPPETPAAPKPAVESPAEPALPLPPPPAEPKN
jgi:hypothetical protein